ncbi:tetratricopeptide repeat protein [Maribacter sp. HTCC2170]|uniref:tetratricopeptide repeat protein n=1 Tax=Maribacter sp. (strain HTCC2170 / KCCM 42371) TaxID=313603 RepID=UPI00006B48B7|nr:tetratricopeptide repeat protein [Maribacter sp. HTCC2170]EAR02002.1 TPR repeat protein [Maribacter sp. HTCC2170]
MKTTINLVLLILLCLGCKDKKTTPAIASLDLVRGELLLCGDGQFGEIKFSLSCSYETRADFDLAVALLHSFQYAEAEKAFVKVIDADPNCPMAYWGVAMSIYHAAWFPPSEKDLIKGSKVLAVAKQLSMDEKQHDYINAIDSFYSDWQNVDHKTRAKRFEEEMEKIYLKYPEDIEAAIFYTLALYSTRDRVGKEYKNEIKAGKILESLFADNPDHPGIAHYIIHNYDNSVLAEKGLETARRYAKIAPSSSHAQHMPSHIFTRLGIWEESIQSNIESAESSRCYTQALGINEGYFEELHAIDYLVYAYLQKGDNAKAEEQYELINKLRSFYPTTITAVIYPIAAIPSRLALENKNWERAVNLELQEMDLDWEQFPWQKAIHHFAKALGASNTKDFSLAEEQIAIITKLYENLAAQNDRSKFIQVKQVQIQVKTAQAWLQFNKNDKENGLALMQEAAEMERKTSLHPVTPGDVLPAIELLGDMLLDMNRPKEALAAYQENLNKHPERFNGVYGAAIAAKQSGNLEKANQYFNQLIDLTKNSDSTRPEIEEAKKFIQKS